MWYKSYGTKGKVTKCPREDKITKTAKVMLEMSVERHGGACRQPGTIPITTHSHDTLYFSSGVLRDYNLLVISLKKISIAFSSWESKL